MADPDYQVAAQDPILVDRRDVAVTQCMIANFTSPGLHWDSTMLDWVGDGNCPGDVTIVLDRGGPHIFDFQFFGDSERSDWKLDRS